MGRFAQILGVAMLMGGAGLGALGGPYYMLDWGGTLVIAGAVIGSAGVLLTVLGTLIRQVAWLRADIQGLAHFTAGGAFPHPDKDEEAQQIDLPPGSFTPAEAEERAPAPAPDASPRPAPAPTPAPMPPQPAEPPANLPPAAGLHVPPAAGAAAAAVAAAGAAGGGLAVVARSILSSVSGPADAAGPAPSPSPPDAAAARDEAPAHDRDDIAELQADLGGDPEEDMAPAGESAPASSKEGVIAAYSVGSSSFTMYVDGRIRASMPDGEREFASMEELKTFMAERRVSP